MINLNDPISQIKGIGPKKTKKLSKLGINHIIDALTYFPSNYENRGNLKNLKDLKTNEKATIKGTVSGKIQEIKTKNKIKIYKLPISDLSGTGYVVFYNSPYFKNFFKYNQQYYFYGSANIINGEIQINHPEYTKCNNISKRQFCRIIPKYPLVKGLAQNDIFKLQEEILLNNSINLKEYFPEQLLNKNKICDINYAIKNIHFPSSARALKVAKYRLVFEELFFLQLGLLLIKKKNNYDAGIKFKYFTDMEELVKTLPFDLTNAQRNCLDDIIKDMTSNKSMNRLVQGDVGSGKTIVALIAIYLSYLNGYQSALMAPTEILAEQHYKSFREILKPFGVKVTLLTGSVKEKEELIDSIKNGSSDVVIGTHALIQDKVVFKNLGLVVTDEQHRFGVRQRYFLSQKGVKPNVLVMTATPIPRTLSLILYGDLDISIINELPPGRKYIKTYHITRSKLDKLYEFISNELSKGRQGYIVCPLVEDSDSIEAESATRLYEDLKKNYFKSYNLGLIHGKLNARDKEAIMDKYKNSEIDILISTTVIEVGINVPNSTIMIIQNAERFGLAQLHQLRGRVGRGDHQSYCFLISDSNNKTTKERLKTMTSTNDGFIIAEEDLKLRGPGDFFGTKQHGLPELKIADLFKHRVILQRAQNECVNLLNNFNKLDEFEKKSLEEKINKKFKDYLNDLTL